MSAQKVSITNIKHYTLGTKPEKEYIIPEGGFVRIEANTTTFRGFHHIYNKDGCYVGSIPATFQWVLEKGKNGK